MLINKHRTVVMAGIGFLMTASLLLAMGGDHAQDDNGQFRVDRPKWPTGLQELVNYGGCFHGHWVNPNDEFFFRGDAASFNQFVQQYKEMKQIRPNISVHVGPERKNKLWGDRQVGKYDWKMTVLKRGHGAPRLPNGAVQEYVVTIDVWIDGQVEWSRVNVPKDRSLLVSAYSGKPLYTPTFSGDGELAAVEQEWLQADRVLKSMEDEARQANPLLTTCKKELDLAKKRAGNLGSSKYKYMHDKEHARERKRTFKRLQTWYGALFLADVLKDKTEPLLTCITYDDYLMSMYVEHIPKTTGIEIDIDPEDNTPKAIWDVFTRTFLANRGVFEKRLSALESASGFPSEILEKAKRDAADDMRIFFYRNYLSVATPKALKKQRGDQNVIGRKVGNAVAKARKANK